VKVLVLNAGRSSIKYELFNMTDRSVLASGLLERIGEPESRLTHRHRGEGGTMTDAERTGPVAGHRDGFTWIGAAESSVWRSLVSHLGPWGVRRASPRKITLCYKYL